MTAKSARCHVRSASARSCVEGAAALNSARAVTAASSRERRACTGTSLGEPGGIRTMGLRSSAIESGDRPECLDPLPRARERPGQRQPQQRPDDQRDDAAQDRQRHDQTDRRTGVRAPQVGHPGVVPADVPGLDRGAGLGGRRRRLRACYNRCGATRERLVIALRRRRGRLERDPAVAGEVRLDPAVRVARGHLLLVQRLGCRRSVDVLRRAGAISAHEPCRDAEAPEHRSHRRRKVLAVAAVARGEEVHDWPRAHGGPWRVEGVGEEARVAQVLLDGDGLVVGIGSPGGPLLGERGDRRGAAADVLGDARELLDPLRVADAGRAQLRGGRRRDEGRGLDGRAARVVLIEDDRVRRRGAMSDRRRSPSRTPSHRG